MKTEITRLQEEIENLRRDLRESQQLAGKYEDRYFSMHQDFVDKKNECSQLRAEIANAIESILSNGGHEEWPIVKRLRAAAMPNE